MIIFVTGLCLVTIKWAMDDHVVLLNDKQKSNKVGIEHQAGN